MSKYYSELENPRDFTTALIRESFDKKQDLVISNFSFADDLLKKIGDLFPKLQKTDELIMALNEGLMVKTPEYALLSDEAWESVTYLFRDKEEEYFLTHYDLREKIDLSSRDLQCILEKLFYNIDFLVILYPNYKDFLLNTKKEIKMVLNEIEKKSIIKVPPKSDGVLVHWPNSWYITPNGYLYNTGYGHQIGNLFYSFYNIICASLESNKNVPSINFYSDICNILKRGYVTYAEFQTYAHLAYKFPTIMTPEVEHDIERYKNILKMSEEEYRKTMTSNASQLPHPERSYQKNLITLIIGHLAAETSLYASFARMNESRSKKALLEQLKYLTLNDIRDVLVRFSGFHKIESIVDNTITTSSLNGITEFHEYLEKGWNLHIIPGIVYDKSEDKLSKQNMNSYFVRKHLDKQLAQYEGKGRILIKDKTF